MAYSNIGGYRGWHLQAEVTGVTSDSISVKARIWADSGYSCAWGARTMTMTCSGANNTPQTRSVNSMNNSGNAGSNEVTATFTGLAGGTYYTIGFSYDVRATLSGSYQDTWTGSLGATTTVAAVWNDINAYHPDGSTQNGLIFNLSTSDGGSWSNITNEPSSFTKNIGTTATISNIRTNVTGAHYTTNSVTNSGASSFTWTFNTANYVVHLYSAWNTYTISYNANGGSGAPGNQTKTYGTNLTLSSTKPTRTYYTFLGWSTSSTATSASYGAGATLTSDLSTTNGATVTLYAVWLPNPPTSLTITRTGSTTTSISVSVSATGLTMTNYTLYYRIKDTGNYVSKSLGTSTTGTITGLAIDTDYQVYFIATNAGGTTTSGTVIYSTTLNNPSITTPVKHNLFPFMVDISATGSITPSRTLTYAFSKDGGTTWTTYQSSNTYHWEDLNDETSYRMGVRVKATHIGTNASDTTATSYLDITTPIDQARARLKKDGQWVKGRVFLKNDNSWKKAKKMYIKKDGVWVENKNFYTNEPSIWD